MISTSESRKAALAQLRATTCVCTNRKAPGKSVCRNCYERLPLDLRGSLYAPIGKGYEEAYAAATERLGFTRAFLP